MRAPACASLHACSPEPLDRITEREAFRIVAPWLRLAATGLAIEPRLPVSDGWLEIGSPERVAAVRAALAQGGSGRH